MNKAFIIGNLTRDPESRNVGDKTVCNFTVAVNRRSVRADSGEPDADFFRVAAWGKTGESCQKYLSKGRKVCVIGRISARAYADRQSGEPKASLEIMAEDVEFLSPANQQGGYQSAQPSGAAVQQSAYAQALAEGYTPVSNDDVPF